MTDSVYAPPTAEVSDPQDASLLATAIGPKQTDYYLAFAERAAGRPWVLSWNWPAFFITSFWLLYRKLWLGYFVYALFLPLGIVALGGALGAFISEAFGAVFNVALILIYPVVFPAFCNALYLRKLNRLIQRAEQKFSNDAARSAWLAKKGGTSTAWIWVLVITMLLGIIAAIALPAYQEYVEAARLASEAAQP